MKIASNKIADMIRFYKEHLSDLYDEGELNAITHLVFEHYMGFSRTDLLLKQEEYLNQSDLLKIYDACKALRTGAPVQYVLGETEFYGLKFKVNASVLIPRPETEELVELILKDLPSGNSKGDGLRILDIGTGSGCIPITLKKKWPDAEVFAMDISQEALHTAEDNAHLNHTPVHFMKEDILNPDPNYTAHFQIIVSNPPYIAKQEADAMEPRVKDFEPHTALFVEEEDPLIFYRKIITFTERHLSPGGSLYFELNPLYAENLQQVAHQAEIFQKVDLLKDMSGKQRFLRAIRH